MRRRALLSTALLTMAVLGAGPAGAADLRIGLAAPVTSVDPHFANATPNNAFTRHIFDMLTLRSPEGAPEPGLATEWRALSDNEWEFKLRPGVTWHDGQPFTADDVVFSFARAPSVPNSPASFGGALRNLQRVEVVDPLTLRLHTSEPTPNLPRDLTAVAIVSRRVAEGASTADFNSGKAAIGTGPYRFGSYTPGSQVEVTRNDAWWGAKQEWDRVVFRMLTNAAARTAALLSGDVDMIASPSPSDLPRLRGEANIAIAERQGTRLIYMSPDFSRTGETPFITGEDGKPLPRNPLLDVRVRRALSLAVNREALAERVLQGMAEPTGQWMPRGAFGFNPDVAPPAQDLNQARQLLTEAGYPRGFRMVLNASNDRYVADAQVAQAVAQMWTRVGVNTTVEAQPFATYLARASRQEFSMVQESWGSTSGEAGNLLLNVVHTYDAARRRGASNDTRYSNPALDERINRALSTIDDAARERLIRDAVRDTTEDVAIIPLFLYKNSWATRRPLTYLPRSDDATLAMGVSR
ncbi:ABC transporter substrate-binding protein [Roseomonas sp. BN140053]|uniref:ABC transporter substrate-binding protein n=1 Tax=Roseomonas sp. BN140053 TaxID=3391898 RepID=UPI0039E7DC4A